MNQLDFDKIIDNAEYLDQDLGELVLSVHFQSCFYFWNGHTPQIRNAIKNCYGRYMELWGQNITWGFDPLKDWKQKPFDKLPSFEKVLNELSDADDLIEWYVADKGCKDEEVDIANQYVFSCITSRAWEIHEGSILYFRLPRQLYFQEKSLNKILDFNQYCIKELSPWYSVSGMQAATSFEGENAKIDLVSQARDFKGIYIEETWDKTRMHYGIRSFDWLTYISNGLAEKIGGSNLLEKRLKEDKLKFIKLSNGLLIQASEHPELIPNETPDPQGYIKLNNIIRPLRDGNYGSMGDATYIGNNYQSFDNHVTDLWIRRFDNPRVWTDLSSSAKSRQPSNKILLKSNELCQMSGRYRYDQEFDFIRNQPMPYASNLSREGDYRSYITLNKGDIAPYYIKFNQFGNVLERLTIEWTLFEEFNY